MVLLFLAKQINLFSSLVAVASFALPQADSSALKRSAVFQIASAVFGFQRSRL